MFRKLILTAGATVAIAAAAASIPTAASAGWHGHHFHGYHGWHSSFAVGFYVPTVVAVPECYVVRRLVLTPRGERWRSVTVCG